MSSTVSDKDMSGPAPQIEPVLKRVNADVKRIDLSPARCFLETSALIIVKIGLLQIDTGPLVMQLTGLILLLPKLSDFALEKGYPRELYSCLAIR